MRFAVAAVAALLGVGVWVASPVVAGPTVCDYPACTPGIAADVVLGASCDNTSYYVFGVTDWGRLVFCGSPRRYEPRWFRSPPMAGIKDENSDCTQYAYYVAQAPDGLFLTCVAQQGHTTWIRADT